MRGEGRPVSRCIIASAATHPASQSVSQRGSLCCSLLLFRGKTFELGNLGTLDLGTWELWNFGGRPRKPAFRRFIATFPQRINFSIFQFFNFSVFLFRSLEVLRLCEGCRTLSVDSSLFVVVVRSFFSHSRSFIQSSSLFYISLDFTHRFHTRC